MHSKRKFVISMLVVSFVLVSIIATIVIAYAWSQQTIKTTLNIRYIAENIDGTATASYTVGGVTNKLTAMKGENVIGDTLVFKASDKENAGNLMFPQDALALTNENDNVVIQYTYSNTGSRHYIASMSFDANIEAQNMKVEYSINGTNYSEDRYAVVVPEFTSNRSYWIKISIVDKSKSAVFKGDFNWLLQGCDPQTEDYKSLAYVDFQATGTSGSYSVNINGDGYLPNGSIVFPSKVGKNDVSTIVKNTSLSSTKKALIKSVYIPESVTTIDESAFEGFTNLETIRFEQSQSSSVSVLSTKGLTTIGRHAFKNCESLDNLFIPKTITSIDSSAFIGCNNLKNVTIDLINDDIVSIINSLGEENNEMNLTIGNSVTSIGESAFYNCKGLTSVVISDSVTSIGESAFSDCTGLTSVIFENKVGWKVQDINGFENGETFEIAVVDLEDVANAANLLKDTYLEYFWTKTSSVN